MKYLCLLFVFTSLGFAQVYLSSEQLNQMVEQATETVAVVMPLLRNEQLAISLKKSAKVNGIKIFVITEASQINRPFSRIPDLALLSVSARRLGGPPGLSVFVRLVDNIHVSPRVLIDGRWMATGDSLGDSGNLFHLIQDPAVVRAEIDRFNQVWQTAKPCSVTVASARLVCR